MLNVIEEFYHGNLEPMEMSSGYAPRLKKQLSKLTAIEERLYERLTDEDKVIFNSYRDVYGEFTSMSCADSFLNGFRLGGKFAVDMLAE